MHPRILELANTFLAPWTNRIQLHLTQVIRLMPGQGAQPLHRDRLAWGGYIPADIEPQFNTIWALTDFTEENGATRIVPLLSEHTLLRPGEEGHRIARWQRIAREAMQQSGNPRLPLIEVLV